MANFRAGGLATGLDTNSIIDQLVKIEGRQIDILRQRQSGLKSQVSLIGDISSKLSALQTAAQALADSGALGVKASSVHTAFSASPGSSATSGRYAVQVTQLAQAAKARSQGFASATAPVQGSNLKLNLNGTEYDITVGDGSTLADVAYSINQLGAPVGAVVLNDGTNHFLSITSKDTGHTIGQPASSALSITETLTGTQGQPLGAVITQNAANARVSVDGLTFERQNNELTDVIPGTTLSLSETMTAAQDLVLGNDATATQKNLQKFADAYNDVLKVLQRQLNVTSETNREVTLSGDSSIRSLQARLQQVISTQVSGMGSVRSLADLGFKTARDGSVSIDKAVLEKALSQDPSAINELFSKSNVGLAEVTEDVVKKYVNSLDGLLTSRKKTLQSSINRMDDNVANLEMRLEAFRTKLINQFTSMERTVAGLNTVGKFLTQQDAQATKG